MADLTELETFSEIGHKEFSTQNWKSAIKYSAKRLLDGKQLAGTRSKSTRLKMLRGGII